MMSLFRVPAYLLTSVREAWGFVQGLWHRSKTLQKQSFDAELAIETCFVAKKISQDGSEALRKVESKGLSARADKDADGSVSYSIAGTNRRGEEGVLEVCATLIGRLNQEGADWSGLERPGGVEQGIDCLAKDGVTQLAVQMIRAVTDQSVWRALGLLGQTGARSTVEAVVAEMRSSIGKKEKKVPPDQRGNIVLALDASDSMAHAFNSVVKRFRDRFGQEVRSLGFNAIWVVGPTADSSARLDITA